jgi:hypothetical protein
MFAARQRPLLVLEDRLLALRLSLNTPVLATEEVANGPARAAICAWAEGSARRFALAVRALRGGDAVVYELQHEVPPDADGWSVALDSALSFGESMGFVFDDEMVVDRRAETLRRAVETLRALIAPGDYRPDVDEAFDEAASDAQIGSSEDMAEILLEDELDALSPGGETSADEDTGSFAAPPPEVATPSETPAFAPGVALSKFRGPAPKPASRKPEPVAKAAPPARPSAPESPSASAREVRGGATLGRVRPRRVLVGGDSGDAADPLLRLLADF